MAIDVQLSASQTDIAGLGRMFDRLRDEGKKSFIDAVAWTAWYVGKATSEKTPKEKARLRPFRETNATDPQIIAIANKTDRSTRQAAGYWRYKVEKFTRIGDGSKVYKLVNRDQNLAEARRIRNQGFSKKSWLWAAAYVRRKAEKMSKTFDVEKSKDPYNPGFRYTNKVVWMYRIVGNLSGVFARSEQIMRKYFENAAIRAAKKAGA